MTVVLVALGAAAGAVLRHLIARFNADFPWGTLLVNVAGSLLLGVLMGLPATEGWKAVLGTGFCGALTTYSTFGFETLSLMRGGEAAKALAYAGGSVLAGLAAAAVGLLAAAAV